MAETAEKLGPVFAKHGYAFLYLAAGVKAFPQTKLPLCRIFCKQRKRPEEMRLGSICSSSS
jgi:hypothetical protein